MAPGAYKVGNLKGDRGPMGPMPQILGRTVMVGDQFNVEYERVQGGYIIHTTLVPGPTGSAGKDGAPGSNGADGKSAYDLWKAAGNTGTVSDYLASLKGAKGDTGPAGKDGTNAPIGQLVTGSLTINLLATKYLPVVNSSGTVVGKVPVY